MGRELRRVPPDFDWPIGEAWAGHLNPFAAARSECPACGGSGYAPAARRFAGQWYGDAPFDPAEYGATPLTIDHPAIRALAARNVDCSPDYYRVRELGRERAIRREMDRLFGHFRAAWSHHLIQADVDALAAEGRLPAGLDPTPEAVNAWSLAGMGHDGINQHVCIKARCAREGVPATCPDCGGDGAAWPSRAHRDLADRFVPLDPPAGEGFQLWQTTSEDAPISPVFLTLDGLCTWAADHATTFAHERASAASWRAMLDGGLVCHREGNRIFL
jgi:hypothetical protein